jgi:hypothetical protein
VVEQTDGVNEVKVTDRPEVVVPVNVKSARATTLGSNVMLIVCDASETGKLTVVEAAP